MASDDQKITIQFNYPDRTANYLVSESEAMELEILAITKPPKRLVKRIRRVANNILERAMEDEVNLDLILGSSRSGDIYNALKYLEFKEIILRRKDIKLIKIESREELKKLIKKIESLLRI